jgi:hypothetical protein
VPNIFGHVRLGFVPTPCEQLVASTLLRSASLVLAGVWWWTKQSQASLDKIASANEDIRSFRERMTALCGQ